MENYCERYCNSMYAVAQTFAPAPRFEGDLVKEIAKELGEKVPINKLQERRNWRDRCLTQLSILKKKLSRSE
jgi:L-gulonate 3-dehydrogenase